MENEKWRPVVGYEGQYEVSDLGRVRGLDRFVRSKSGGRRFVRGRLLKPTARNQYGHLKVVLSGQKARTIHSLVAEAFLGPRPPGMVTRHLNGVRTDNRAENLAYGTISQNHRDCYEYGGRHGSGKLTREQVLEVKALIRAGVRQTDIAKRFGVNDGTIQQIRTGKTFSYIK